jgi:hypothetical protein
MSLVVTCRPLGFTNPERCAYALTAMIGPPFGSNGQERT